MKNLWYLSSVIWKVTEILGTSPCPICLFQISENVSNQILVIHIYTTFQREEFQFKYEEKRKRTRTLRAAKSLWIMLDEWRCNIPAAIPLISLYCSFTLSSLFARNLSRLPPGQNSITIAGYVPLTLTPSTWTTLGWGLKSLKYFISIRSNNFTLINKIMNEWMKFQSTSSRELLWRIHFVDWERFYKV